MQEITTFLGETINYWVKLRDDLVKGGPSAERYFKETVKLHAKISFYEVRIREMTQLMDK
jgi:hypothetical protein